MHFRNSILSRLFGSKPEENMKEEIVLERQDGVESQPEVDLARLELSPEHVMNQLWKLWVEQTRQEEGVTEPVLRLAGTLKQPELLSEDKLEAELERLWQIATSTADKRFEEARPKWELLLGETDVQEDAGLDASAMQEETGSDTSDVQEEIDSDASDVQDAGSDMQEDADSDVADKQIEVIPRLDAQVVLFLTRDDMSAWFLVYPPAGGGKEVDRDMLANALNECGVKFGVDEVLLERLPGDEKRYFQLHLAAEGKLPVQGKDGYTVDKFPRTSRKDLAEESGQIDYANLNVVHNIEEGGVICDIIAPGSGVAGATVLGKEVPAKDGRKAIVPRGRNTVISEDGTTLVATKTGRIEFNGRDFEVKTALEISENVDYSTGNVDFMGDIYIRGDVRGGFTVKATGNITVDGVVEDSIIEAGGDLVVAKGIKGDDQAVIRAGRSVYVRYLENSTVCARENLLSDCVVNCDVYCDGAVNACSGRGSIIGGKIRAGREVRANAVGSRAECTTLVSLGGKPSEEFEHEELRREIKDLQEELERLERQPNGPERLKNLPMVRMKLSVSKTRMEQLEKAIRKREEKREDPSGKRLACEIAYSGTEIVIGAARHRLKYEVEPCKAVYYKGEIRLV